MQSRQGENGSALVIALMLLMALGFVGAALIFTAGGDLKVSGADRRGTQAEFAAEGGVQEAMHRLALDPGTNVTVNGKTFDAAIRDTTKNLDPNWQVRIYAPGGTAPVSAGSLTYTPTVQSTSTALDYMRNGSYLTIRHKWRDLNGDGVRDPGEVVLYDPSKLPPENFASGSPIEVIQVDGYRATARRRLEVETSRFPFSPNVMAALSCNNILDLKGTVNVCGHNHDSDTPENTNLESKPPCSPDYDRPSGSLYAVMSTGDPVLTGGSSNLLGEPAATDTSGTNPFYSLAEALGVDQGVVDQLLASADHTSFNDSPPLDGITYIQGNAQPPFPTRGSGLLYVTGDLKINNSFSWRGLIYVEGDFKITGNPWILGAVMVRGGFGGGNASILYSEDALRLSLELAFDYVVLSWKEL